MELAEAAAGRFIEVLLFLLGFSVLLYTALQVVFNTRLYRVWLGDGLNGQGSRWCKNGELRPWISMAVGVLLANSLGLDVFSYLININISEAAAGMKASGIHLLGFKGTMILCQVLTGLTLGGGPKAIIAASRAFGDAKNAIVDNLKGVKKDEQV